MRHSCVYATVSLLALTLAGCGPESTSGSNFRNPATSVSLSFESFTLRNETGMPETLPQTIFYDFYRGLEPAEGEDDEGIAAQLRERLDLLMGLTPSEDGDTYTAARNPLDLLHNVISSNDVDTFDQGRRLMRDSITDGEGARYNTPDTNALIRFTENDGSNTDEPAPDQIWIYPLLDWTSNPRLNKIYRGNQFIAGEQEDDGDGIPEVSSAIWSGQFDAPEFSVSGYNRPEFAATSLTGRELGNVEFWQEFIGEQSDTLILNGTSGITIDGDKPDYICVELDYEANRVRVYSSSGEAEALDDSEADDELDTVPVSPVECDQQGTGDPVEYTSITINERQ